MRRLDHVRGLSVEHGSSRGIPLRGRGRDRRWARTMASVGIRKRVSARTGRVTYQVWWRLDDGSQGAKTVDSPDEARDLPAEKRLEMRRGAWQGRRRGRLPFGRWADEWWAGVVDRPRPQPYHPGSNRKPAAAPCAALVRRPTRSSRSARPTLIRRWQNQLAANVGHETLMALPLDPASHPAVRRGRRRHRQPTRSARSPPPSAASTPTRCSAEAKRRALTPEEAGRLLARFPLFWWDHVLCLLGTGLRFGELAGLRRRRVHLDRPMPGPAGRRHPLPGRPVRQRLQAPPQERRRHPRDPTGPAGGRGDPPPAAARSRLQRARLRRSRRRERRARWHPNDAVAPRLPPPLPARSPPNRKATLRICSFAGRTIFGTASRPGWRTTASRPG